MNRIEQQISESVDKFVEELSQLVRQAALESVSEALGGSAPAQPRRGTSARKTTAARRGKAGKKAGRKKAAGGRERRSTAAVADVAEALLAHVKANPGQSISDIAAALGATSKELRLPVLKLIEDGKLRTTGQRRGTKYFAGRGGARPAAKKKTARKKKATRKKKAARKTKKRTTRGGPQSEAA